MAQAVRRLCGTKRAVLVTLLPLACWAQDPEIRAVVPPPPPPEAAPAPPSAPKLVPLTAPKPNLPDDACQRRQSGWVQVEFAVLPEGKVADVKVVDAKPQGLFDAAAIESVTNRLYPAQPAPVKMKERVLMSHSDCRAEQLKAPAASAQAGGEAPYQGDCLAMAQEMKTTAEPIPPAEGARSTIEKDGAQVYSAPSTRCFVSGRTLKYGTRLTAQAEYEGFSLVAPAAGGEPFWLLSTQMKDVSH